MPPSILRRAVLLAGLFASPAALAQSGTQPGTQRAAPPATAHPADPSGAAPAVAPGPHPGQSGVRKDRVERRIEELHGRLHIAPAQEPQWAQFAQVMRDNARDMDQIYEDHARRLKDMNAVDNMASYAKVVEAHAQDVQKLVPAFRTLYEALSPDQRRTADQLFRRSAERAQQRALGRRG